MPQTTILEEPIFVGYRIVRSNGDNTNCYISFPRGTFLDSMLGKKVKIVIVSDQLSHPFVEYLRLVRQATVVVLLPKEKVNPKDSMLRKQRVKVFVFPTEEVIQGSKPEMSFPPEMKL